MFYVYFAKSTTNDKVYVGKTSKLPDVRVQEHNHGSNKFTSHNGPFKLMYYETYICKEDATNRERFYKTGLGKQIKLLIVKYAEDHWTRSSVG